MEEGIITTGELQWAAGFLEGEAWFGYTKTTLTLEASQVQREPLERLQVYFGGSIGHRKAKQIGRRDYYSYRLRGARAAGTMMTLYALMSPVRKESIRESLGKWKSKKARFHQVATRQPAFARSAPLPRQMEAQA